MEDGNEFIWNVSDVDNYSYIECYQEKKVLDCKVRWENEPIVKTISPLWLHISTLRDECAYNDVYLNKIKELSLKYVGWKRVRGDGNCYYRSVVSSFIIKIFNINQNSNRIFEFIANLRSIKSRIEDEHKEEFNEILNLIIKYYDQREKHINSRISVFNEILCNLQNDELDLKLIFFSRLLCYYTFIGEKGQIFKEFIEESSIDCFITKLLQNGQEAEGLELSLLPLSLGITVRQVNIISDKILYITYPESETSNNNLVVDIISKCQGHYDALYSIQDMEDDDYNMKLGAYMVAK